MGEFHCLSNLDLIKACEILAREGYDIELIQVGITVDKEIMEYIEESAIGSWCKILPPVSLKEIPQLIANCDLPVMLFRILWHGGFKPDKAYGILSHGEKGSCSRLWKCFTDVFGSRSDLVFYYKSNSQEPVKEIAKAIRSILDNNGLAYCNFFRGD
jgi:hypothetical protein